MTSFSTYICVINYYFMLIFDMFDTISQSIFYTV
jgi:hypothetical protein